MMVENPVTAELRPDQFNTACDYLNKLIQRPGSKIVVDHLPTDADSDRLILDPTTTRFYPDGIICKECFVHAGEINEFLEGQRKDYTIYDIAIIGGVRIKVGYPSSKKPQE